MSWDKESEMTEETKTALLAAHKRIADHVLPERVKKPIFVITKRLLRREKVEDLKAKLKIKSSYNVPIKGTKPRLSKDGVKLKLDFSKLPYGGGRRVKKTKYGTKILLRGALNNRNDCQEVMRFWQETATRSYGGLSMPRGLF